MAFEGLEGFTGNTFNIYFDGVLKGTYIFPLNTANFIGISYKLSQIYNSLQFPGYFSFATNKFGYFRYLNQNVCGGPSLETVYGLKIVGEHQENEITIKLSLSSYSNSAYWKINYYNYKIWTKAISSTCGYSCTSCNSTACQYCSGNYLNQEDVCVTACSSGYKSLNGKCFVCHSSCLDCTDDDPNSCISCPANRWLLNGLCLTSCPLSNFYSNGNCVISCPTSQYLNSTNNSCLNCSSGCRTCNGPLSNNCLSCNIPQYWSYFSCLTSCSSSQYLNSLNNSCTNCDSTCKTCSGPSSNNCLTCFAGKVYSNGLCLNVCSSTQYYNSSDSSCLNCDSSCLSCVGPFANNCTSCAVQKYFSYGSCLNSCNATQYLDSSNNYCLTCNSSCQSCNGPYPNNCLSCPIGTYFSYGSCPNACNSSQYLDSSSSCLNCDPSCQTCIGPFSNDCSSCPPNLLLGSGSCGSGCNSNQYIASNICQNCDPTCQTCSGPFTYECTSCPLGKFYSDGSCLNICNSDQYLNSSNFSCSYCDSTCLTCDGPSSNNCLSCDTSIYHYYNSSCVNNCSISQYTNLSNVSCEDCDSTCLTCNGPLSNECISCFPSTYFSSGYCLSNCPSHQYRDSSTFLCLNCDISCHTCDGPLLSDCTSCSSPLYFSNKYCVSSCASNQFADVFYQCQFCDESCLTCIGSNSNECSRCPQGSYFYDGICNSSCPFGFFPNSFNNSCLSCSNSCLTCFGNSFDNCDSCFNGQYLLNSKCFSICPSNYYPNNTSNNCVSCDSSCFECNGPLNNNCLSCITSNLTLSNGYCIDENCLANQYYNGLTFSCQNCSYNCNSCNGPNLNNCLSCNTGHVYFGDLFECRLPTVVYFTVNETKNPTEFDLTFSNETELSSISTFLNNINKTLTITISNFVSGLFNYSLQQINMTNYRLILTFMDNVYPDSSYLMINLNSSNDNTLLLMNRTTQILLSPFELCAGQNLFYENQSCHPKILIDYYWMKSENFNEILVLFSQTNYNFNILNPTLVNAINSNVFSVLRTSYSNNILFNYNFQVNSDSLRIVLTFNDTKFVKQDFLLKLNETQLYSVKDSQKISIIRKVLYFTISNDYYKTEEKNLMASTKSTTENGFIAATILYYVSYGLNPKSTFAIKGILLTRLFQLSKFLEIMFPLNARLIFSNFSKNTYFVKQDIFQANPLEYLLHGLPQLFLSYHVSLYLLNEIINEYIIVSIFLGIGILFLMFDVKNKNLCGRIFAFLKSLFVWNMLISYCSSLYVETTFYTFVCLRFGFFFSKFNTFLTIFYICYVILLPLHIFKAIFLISKSNNISQNFKDGGKIVNYPQEQDSIVDETSKSSPTGKKSKFYNERIITETDSPLKHVQNWENFKDYKTPTLKNLFKKKDSSIPTEKTSNGSITSLKKVVPWETITEHYDPESLVSKKNLETNRILQSDSQSTCNSKSKIFPSQQNHRMSLKLDIIESINCTSVEDNNNNNSNKEVVIVKSSNIFICFRFLSLLVDFLYKIKDPQKYQSKYNVLTRDFKIDSCNKYQIVNDFARFFLIAGTVVILYGYSFLQTTIISFINLIYFINLLSSQPYRRKGDFYFTVFNEICLNGGFFSTFFLSYFDIQEKLDLDLRINFGWLYVFSYIFLLLSLILSSIIKIFYSLKYTINQCMKKK